MKRNYIIKSIASYLLLITLALFQACEKDDILNEEIQSLSTSDQSGLDSRSNSVPDIWLQLQDNEEELENFVKAYGTFNPLLNFHDPESCIKLYGFVGTSSSPTIRSVLLSIPQENGNISLLSTVKRLQFQESSDTIVKDISTLMSLYVEEKNAYLNSEGHLSPRGGGPISDFLNRWKVKCYKFGKNSNGIGDWFRNLGSGIGDWFTNTFGGDGSGGGGHSFADTYIFSPSDDFFTGHYGNEVAPGYGSGGGGREPQLCESINRETVYPTVFQVQQMVTLFSQNTGIPIYGDPNLHDILDVTCLTLESYDEFEQCLKRSLACYYGYGLEEYLDYLVFFSDDSGDFDIDCFPRNPTQGRNMLSALRLASNDFVTCDGMTQYEHVSNIVEANCGAANIGDLAQAALAAPENGVWINRAALIASVSQGLNTTPEGLSNLTNCEGETALQALDAAIAAGCTNEAALEAALRSGFEGEDWIDLAAAIASLEMPISTDIENYLLSGGFDCSGESSIEESLYEGIILYYCELDPSNCELEGQNSAILPWVSGYILCESFEFSTRASGQTACINGLKFSHAGVQSPNYCLCITLPRNSIRVGNVDPYEAADCSAHILNTAGKTAMIAYLAMYNSPPNSARPITWPILWSRFFKPAVKAIGKTTECDYAIATDCISTRPLPPNPSIPVFAPNFFAYLASESCYIP